MSLKKNFIFSSILTVSTYLFPLIVYPYVSRTLGLSNIGIVNFVDNLVNYFVFVSMMGISTVGVREIASVRSDRQQLSTTFMSLLSLTMISTVVAIVALWTAMYTVPTLAPFRDLLYVGIVKLVFNLLLIEWFFVGMEDFKYITMRSLLVKCIYVASIFLFIKQPSDYKLYFMLTVITVVVNALINIVYSRHFVSYSFRGISLKPYYKAFLIMGIYILFTNVYTYLNPVWLGFVTNTDEVGYFTTATKLHHIIMAVLLSFSNILYPRVSNLLSEGKETEFWDKINIAFEAIFLFSFPTIVYLLVAGPELLHLFVGDGFEGSYLPLRIISPLVLIIGIEQILIIQILLARHQDTIVLCNSFIGALAALVLNILLTASMGAAGSAVVWVAAECVILVASALVIFKLYHYTIPLRRLSGYCLTYAPLLVISAILYRSLDKDTTMLAIQFIVISAYTILAEMLVLRNRVVTLLQQSMTSFFRPKDHTN
jgi:O-antigen/teichoic acid export membrane protein